MDFLLNKKFGWFVLKFLLVFGVLYFGTLLMIGLAAPGKHYSAFVHDHLDYVSGIKNMILYSTKGILSLFGIKTLIEQGFVIRYLDGKAIVIAMSCVGYGVYSFWTAFVVANDISWKKKMIWVAGGLLLLFSINVIRICLFLTAVNKGWAMPLGIDHHTWFNIFAYIAIFMMMWRFERKQLRVTNDELRMDKSEQSEPDNK